MRRGPSTKRGPYPSTINDEEWAFVAPYLSLCREDARQRAYPARQVYNALRWLVRTGRQWRYLPNDFPPWPVVYQQTQRWIAAGCFEALVHDLRALLRMTEDRAPAPTAVVLDGIQLEVVKLPEAKRGFVLLPRRWVVERTFAWIARFRRLARDYERLPETLAGLHFIAIAGLLLHRVSAIFPSA